MGGELAVPGVEQIGPRCAGADPADQRVSLRQGAGVRRPRARAGGPERHHDAVDVGASAGRSALHQVEPIGQEDADERARRIDPGHQARAVHPDHLLDAGLDAHLQGVQSVLGLDVHLHARHRRPHAHDLARVRGPARLRGEPEVEGLEHVRLAGAVGANHHVEPGPESDLGALVVAEVPQDQARDVHGGSVS